MLTIGVRSYQEQALYELTTQGLASFTDDSKPETGFETTIWRQGSRIKVVCKLDIHATTFQAKVMHIAISAQGVLVRDCRSKAIVICSDGQATMGVLDGYLVRSGDSLGELYRK